MVLISRPYTCERCEQIAGRNVARKTVEALSLGVGEQTNRHDLDSG
jgi:hypothetical protein